MAARARRFPRGDGGVEVGELALKIFEFIAQAGFHAEVEFVAFFFPTR